MYVYIYKCMYSVRRGVEAAYEEAGARATKQVYIYFMYIYVHILLSFSGYSILLHDSCAIYDPPTTTAFLCHTPYSIGNVNIV